MRNLCNSVDQTSRTDTGCKAERGLAAAWQALRLHSTLSAELVQFSTVSNHEDSFRSQDSPPTLPRTEGSVTQPVRALSYVEQRTESVLTKRITACKTLFDLEGLLQNFSGAFTVQTLSAALYQFALLVTHSSASTARTENDLFELASEATLPVERASPAEGQDEHARHVLAGLLQHIESKVAQSDLQSFSNFTSAYAQLQKRPDVIDNAQFAQLMNSTLQHLCGTNQLSQKLSPEQLSVMCWAVGKLEITNPQLLQTLAYQAVANAPHMSDKGVAAIMWGFSTLGYYHYKLYQVYGQSARLPDVLATISPAALSNLLKALTRIRQPNEVLLAAVHKAVLIKVRSMPEHILASLLSSLAVLTRATRASAGDEAMGKLFEVAAGQLTLAAAQLPASAIAQVAAAYGSACHYDDRLFVALATEVVSRPQQFSAQGLSGLCWCWARNTYYNRHALDVLLRAAGPHLADMSATDLTHMAWALAHLDHHDDAVWRAVQEQLDRRRADFSAPNLCMIAWAVAVSLPKNSRHLIEQVFTTVSRLPHHAIPSSGLCQLYTAHLVAAEALQDTQQQLQGATKPPPALRPELAKRANAAWRQRMENKAERDDHHNDLIQAVWRGLCRLGLHRRHLVRRQHTSDGLMMADICWRPQGNTRVAICVEARNMFASNVPGRPLGSLLLRRRFLHHRKYHLVLVAEANWARLETDQQRTAYLTSALQAMT